MNLLPGFAVWGFQVPLPIVALGLVTGATYGVLAVGLVLVYRANTGGSLTVKSAPSRRR